MSSNIEDIVLDDTTLPIVEHIADRMPGGFFIYEAQGEGRILYFNKAVLNIFGCKTYMEFKSLTGNTFKGLVYSEDWQKVQKELSEQLRGSNSLDYIEYRIQKADSSIRWITDYGHLVHSRAYGDIFYVFINDCTDEHYKDLLTKQNESFASQDLKNCIKEVKELCTKAQNANNKALTDECLFKIQSLAQKMEGLA